MGGGECRSLRMFLGLNDYKLKTSRYNYRSTYMNHMVTTSQKPTIDITKTKKKGIQT